MHKPSGSSGDHPATRTSHGVGLPSQPSLGTLPKPSSPFPSSSSSSNSSSSPSAAQADAHPPSPPRDQRQLRSSPRSSSDSTRSAPRSRRTAGPPGGSSLSSSSLSHSASPASCDAQPRHGLARLEPVTSFSPPATVLVASAHWRSPSSPSTPSPSFPLASPALPATPSAVPASSGNAARRSTSSIADDDGSGAGGSSGIAYRSNGSTSLGTSASTFAISQSPIAADTMMERPSGPVRSFVRRTRARSPWGLTLLTAAVSLLGAVLLGLILKSLVTRQYDLDPKGCRMSYMRPSYAHLADFDTEHTRFASKYSLYLYREQGVDEETKLKGIPVLFIPGNAGSYKQVRPIAAEAAVYFHDVVQHDEAAVRGGARNLDFFTVDFNEDITAFHGQTMLDQAEYLNEAIRYILSLYLDPRMAMRDSDLPDPTSVIVLGHSMGGIVARTMLIMPNYQSNSINTIVTLSAPHARAPVTFDSEIVKVYDRVNDYWRHAYAQQWANNNPLWHVTLVSIAGGGLDTIVPSDYASLESLVPETHGFTVFTTTIPNVWTSMDHQAILWCDQFRKAISRALYDIVDVHRATQTKPRAERMRAFKKHFLTGMEPIAEREVPSKEPTTLLTLEDRANTIIPQGDRLVMRNLGSSPRFKAHLMPIPPPGSPVGKRFTLLTDQQLDKAGEAGKVEVLFCSAFPHQPGQAGIFPIKLDLSGEGSGSTRLSCKNAASDLIVLPASRRSSRFPFSLGDEREASPFSYLQYDIEHISDHQFVVVIDKATTPTPGFVLAEFSDNAQSHRTRDTSLYSLVTFGLSFRLPAHRPMVTEIKIPAIQSSLLAYRLEIGSQPCGESAELFTPLVRQYLSEPFESKYYVNARHASISLHGVAPFMPPALNKRKAVEDGLSLQFWTDPTCNSSMEVQLTVDVMGSLGKLYMRYRTVFAAFPVVFVALVFQKQFSIYDETGIFVSFSEGLDLCLRQSIPLLVAGLTFLSLSAGNPQHAAAAASSSSSFWNWRNVTEAIVDFRKNDLLVGTQDPFYWFLVPLISVVCIGTCTAINYAALALTYILGLVVSVASSRPAWVRHATRRGAMQQTASVAGAAAHGAQEQSASRTSSSQQPASSTSSSSLSSSSSASSSSSSSSSQQYFAPAFIQSTPRRRILTTVVLLLLVSTVIPYQFAYLVACLVQIATTVRALRAASDLRSTVNYNFYNYVHSILVLMLWVLPINLPILAVWVRNLAVHWLTPFSSHHNLLSIMPFIILVETLTTGKMVPRVTTPLRYVVTCLLLGLAIASALYGISYAYMIHHLVNVVVAWLVILHSASAGGSEVWSSTALKELFENGTADRKQGKTP